MEVKHQTLLNFSGVDFVNVNVHIQNPIPHDQNPTADLGLIPKVFYPKERPNEFIIIFDIKLVCKTYFNISIVAFGFFALPEYKGTDIREEKDFININAPAIMFPYVRSFISTLTGNLGTNFKTMIIPPHFFKGDLEEHKELTEENKKASSSTVVEPK